MSSIAAWLPFVRAAAIGWIPLGAQPIPSLPTFLTEKRSEDNPTVTAATNQKIRINVSGQLFETCRNTLNKYPETLLGSSEKVCLN